MIISLNGASSSGATIGAFRRIGRFYVRDDIVVPDVPEVRLVMSKVLVVECLYRVSRKAYEYVAYSECFREVPRGDLIPTYDWRIEDGGYAYAVETQNDERLYMP